MPCFLRLSHEMYDPLAFCKVKIKIDLHSPVMRMWRHGIPNASFFESSYAHYQLAAFQAISMDVFIDHTMIIIVQASQFGRSGLRQLHQLGWIFLVGRAGEENEFCRIVFVGTVKDNFLFSLTNIETI